MSPVEWLEHHFHSRSAEYLNRFRRPANRSIVEFQPLVSQKARWIWRSEMTPCLPCWMRTGYVVPDTSEHAATRHAEFPLAACAGSDLVVPPRRDVIVTAGPAGSSGAAASTGPAPPPTRPAPPVAPVGAAAAHPVPVAPVGAATRGRRRPGRSSR